MIEIFDGRIGGGKTYSAVVRIAEYLANGGYVVTNIEMKREGLHKFVASQYGVDFDDSMLIQIEPSAVREIHNSVPAGTMQKPSLLVIDEAGIHYNNRDATADTPLNRSRREFWTQSRKLFVDAIIIAQHYEMIDLNARRCCQFIWRMRDLSRLALPGWLGGARLAVPIIAQCQYDYDGKTLIRRRLLTRNRAVYQSYDSFALQAALPNLSVAPVHAAKVKRVNQRKLLVQLLMLLALAGTIGVGCAGKAIEKKRQAELDEISANLARAAAALAAASSQVSNGAAAVSAVGLAADWRREVTATAVVRGRTGLWELGLETGEWLKVGSTIDGARVLAVTAEGLVCEPEPGVARIVRVSVDRIKKPNNLKGGLTIK